MDTQTVAPPKKLLDIPYSLDANSLVESIRNIGVVEYNFPTECLGAERSRCAYTSESEDTECCVS